MSPQDPNNRQNYRVGEETKEISELQVKVLQGNAMILVQGSVRIAGYDLCAAGNYVISS